MNTPSNQITLDAAFKNIPAVFRTRILAAYHGIKEAYRDNQFDSCGLRAGRFCEVVIRWLQFKLTGSNIPFGSKIVNFKEECENLEAISKNAGHESLRLIIPRAINFMYTLRNKRGIGHEGGDIDANEIDAATLMRIADWCICEILRLEYSISLEEAQAICNAITERELPQVWNIFGRRRILNPDMSFSDQTLILLYSSPEFALAEEDLAGWTEHANPSIYRRDVLRRLHATRLLEYDPDTCMVAISPKGIRYVEKELLSK